MSEKRASIDLEKDSEIPGITEDDIRSGSVVPEQILKHSHDADEALKAFANHKGPVLHIDEATNKRLLRRIDLHLMPLLCLVYGLNYLDKTTLSYASIMGISLPEAKGGIGLHGDQYNWLGRLVHLLELQQTN
jgi:ACS family allantoate permease-like MFS transporter